MRVKNQTREYMKNVLGKHGLCVRVYDGKVDKALRILKKKVNNEGTIKDLKKHEFFEKPSETRRRARDRAVKRWQKKVRMDGRKEPLHSRRRP